MTEISSGASAAPRSDPAVVDLLGVLAYAELIAFERLADDARLAPTLTDKAALAAMAVAEFGHFQRLEQHLRRIGIDPTVAMEPFVEPLDAFHDSTAPGDWLEGLVKAYVGDSIAADFYREVAAYVDAPTRDLVLEVLGDSIAADFYREVAAYVDAPTRDLVLEVLGDTGHATFAVDRVRAAIEADPAIAGRLALWARRLVGEALAQAQRVAVDREALTDLIVGGASGSGGLAELGRMLARLTEAHSRRMASLGLSS